MRSLSSIPHRRALPRALPILCVLLAACTGSGTGLLSGLWQPSRPPTAPDQAVYQRAQIERIERMAYEIKRLQADLAQAEDALVTAESGLRGHHSLADAVSSLAEARIRVERAAREAPWRADTVLEAQRKLEEAERQIEAGHLGSAIFFGARAERIAEELIREADAARKSPGVRFIRRERVLLRQGPSKQEPVLQILARRTPVYPERKMGDWTLVRTSIGRVGWVHTSLITPR
ncbi:MAG: SH3 domain-containing protein [Myxococcota bacterium]